MDTVQDRTKISAFSSPLAMLAARSVIVLLLLACLAMLSAPVLSRAQQPADVSARSVVVLDVQGAIGPATTEYLRQGYEAAAERDTALIILRINTPGGLDTSMREIIQDILASPVPVIVYVAPSGARAASAGTYILYASHLAAMAPGTNLGAATPVQLGGGSQPLGEGEDEEDDNSSPADAMAAKVVNDSVAYIRSLAELRGRNADWAEQAVRQAASLSASAAKESNVIEIVATDLDSLLAQADGRQVQFGGRAVMLATAGLEVVEVAPDWRARLLGAITNPNIAYILLLIGIYGIIFEFLSPGIIFSGVIGAIALILALFALNLLPINFAGAGLVLLGIALMAAEAFAPSFGVLGIGGAVAFSLGSLFMFDEVPGFELSLSVVLAATAASGVLLAIILAAVVRTHRRPVESGEPVMIGAIGTVLSWSGERGQVHVHSERWEARSAVPLSPGDRVRVIDRDGLVLKVEPENPLS